MRRASPMRVLLLTIIAAALMLTVRVADLWDGLLDGFGTAPAAAADAEPAEPAADPESAEAAAGAAAEEAGEGEDGTAGDPTQNEMVEATSVPEDALSDAELAALQNLAARRDQLDAREKALDTRAGLLAAGEKRVDAKIAELKELQATLQGLIKTYDEQETAKLASLVKIYENMKPKEAAPILEKLDMDTLLDLVERMKERKVAPILARMNPARAKEITDELARRRQITQAAGGI